MPIVDTCLQPKGTDVVLLNAVLTGGFSKGSGIMKTILSIGGITMWIKYKDTLFNTENYKQIAVGGGIFDFGGTLTVPKEMFDVICRNTKDLHVIRDCNCGNCHYYITEKESELYHECIVHSVKSPESGYCKDWREKE